MNSKQAVNEVLKFGSPAYIPIGTYAIDCDIVEKIIGHKTYVRNKVETWFALNSGRRDEVAQSLKEDSVELFRKLPNIDVIIPFKEAALLPPAGEIVSKKEKLNDTTWRDESGIIYKISRETNDVCVSYPEREYTADDFSGRAFSLPDESVFEAYDHFINAFRDDRFLLGLSGGFEVMPMPGGMENGLAMYLTEPEMIQACVQQHTARGNFMDRFYIRDGADQVFVETDPATTRAPLISPELYRRLCLPAMKERVAHIKKFRDRVFLHSCGNTWDLIGMFIEAGIDCNQSLQTGAGMDLGLLKQRFGKRIAFWGGVPVEDLIGGTPDDVRNDVRDAFKKASGGGGFILGPSHSVAYGTKYDNFMAMLDEHDKLKNRI